MSENAQSTIDALFESVRERISNADFGGAERLLERARPMAEGDDAVARQIQLVARELDEERDQARKLRQALDNMEQMLTDGRLVEADLAVMEARASFGPRRGLSDLRRRLDAIREERLSNKVRELIEEADRLAEAGQVEVALGVLDKARLATPERRQAVEDDLQQALETREMSWSRQVEKRDRKSVSRDLERRTAKALAEHRFDVAARDIEIAARYLGNEDDLIVEQRRLLGKAKRRRLRDRVHHAGLALEAERFDDAVRCLEEALVLDPKNSWLREHLEHAEEMRHAAAAEIGVHVRTLVDAARAAQSSGDLLRARLLMTQALEMAPEDESLRELARELDTA